MNSVLLISLVLTTLVNFCSCAVIGIDPKGTAADNNNEHHATFTEDNKQADSSHLDIDTIEDFDFETFIDSEGDSPLVDDLINKSDIIYEDHQRARVKNDTKPSLTYTSNVPYCQPFPYTLTPEERMIGGGFGWAAATALLIFAFSNTVIIGATMTISYILYQVVIAALAIMAPGVATVFTKFLALFSIF